MILDRFYAAALHIALGTGFSSVFDQILEKCGSFKEFWNCKYKTHDIKLSPKAQEVLELSKKSIQPELLAEQYERDGIKFLLKKDTEFSKELLTIERVPCILYYQGHISLLKRMSLAVVGSRRATAYGIAQSKSISAQLSEKGITIVSGLALGIDTAAHKGALTGVGSTIAVLASGLNKVYPQQNRLLFEEIKEKGLVISEFLPDEQPETWYFPYRNRIISGLSRGTFVTEAGARSGALITADHALNQNKEVFALPGSISSPMSVGPLRLIQQGAKLVISIHDILDEIGYPISEESYYDSEQDTNPGYNKAEKARINESEKKILTRIGYEPVHIDFLIQKYGGDGELFAHLMNLEWKGLIYSIPGNYYMRA